MIYTIFFWLENRSSGISSFQGIRPKCSPFSKPIRNVALLIFVFFTAKAYCLKGDVIKLPDERPPLTGEKTGVEISKAKVEDITSQNYPGLIDSFEFNAPLRDVIKTMSKFLNMNIILGPGIGAERIEIISHSPITVAEAYKAFLSALAIQKLTIIKSGSFLKVLKAESAVKSNLRVYKGHKSINADQFLTRIIKLKHIDADSLQEKMKPFIDTKAVNSLIFYPPSNTVIISGYGSNVEKVRTIIKGIDTPSEDFTLRVFRLRIAQADIIAKIINDIIKNLTPKGNRRYYRPTKNQKKGISQLLNIQSVSHDERTNSIISMGHPTALEKLGALIKTLDSDENTKMSAQIHVYKVKYVKAEELSRTLQTVFQGSSSSSASKDKKPTKLKTGSAKKSSVSKPNTVLAQAFKDVNIIPEKTTNSLFIVSNTANYEVVKTILDQVDVSKNQVFVKAIIMELSTSRNNEWKMANYFFPKDGQGIARIGYGLSNLTDVFSTAEGATLFFPLSLFFTGNLFGTATDSTTDVTSLIRMGIANPGAGSATLQNKIMVPSLSSFVKFLQKTAGANVLSTPQIMALDHEEAFVSITDKIPVQGERTTATNLIGQATTSTRDLDVETLLKITPHIDPNVDSIQMEIEQKIDGVAPSASVPEALQKTNVAIQKRHIKTFITLKDRETAVLGGMVKKSNIKTNSKIPILGDLPLIGWLFKNSTVERVQSNLIVFITPHIIRSAEEHQTLLSSKLKERMKFIRQFTGNEDPYQEVTKKMFKNQNDTFQEKDDSEFEQEGSSIDEDHGANMGESPTREETEQSEKDYYDDDEDYIQDDYSEDTERDNNVLKDNFSSGQENTDNITSSRRNMENSTEETIEETAESGEETTDTIEIKGDWGPLKSETIETLEEPPE